MGRGVSRSQTKKGIKKEFTFYPEGKREPWKVLRRKAISVLAFFERPCRLLKDCRDKQDKVPDDP